MLNWLVANSLSMIPKPIVRRVAKRYIAGESSEDALRVVRDLNQKGIFGTVDVLGEFVKTKNQASQSTQMAHQMLDLLYHHELRSGISVKLTSLGLDIDESFCYSNLRSVMEQGQQLNRFVRIDMENSPYTTRTLDLYKRLRMDGFENTGVVIQACMRRSESDIRDLSSIKAQVRLCKGIYIEPIEIAFRKREEIRENYKKLLNLLFDFEMHVGIATHDEVLIDYAKKTIAVRGLEKKRYEFQMLLGVRESLRNALLGEGYKVRVYVPFGRDWYGYCLRRLKENPEIAGHVIRALFDKNA